MRAEDLFTLSSSHLTGLPLQLTDILHSWPTLAADVRHVAEEAVARL